MHNELKSENAREKKTTENHCCDGNGRIERLKERDEKTK